MHHSQTAGPFDCGDVGTSCKAILPMWELPHSSAVGVPCSRRVCKSGGVHASNRRPVFCAALLQAGLLFRTSFSVDPSAGTDLDVILQRRVAMARWTAGLFNGTDHIIDGHRVRLLSCQDQKEWEYFRKLLLEVMRSGEPIGLHPELVNAAEQLLSPYVSKPRGFFQEGGQLFHAQLEGLNNDTSTSGFCFPGYQSACFVRVRRLSEQMRHSQSPDDTHHLRMLVEENAQFCASIFGKEGVLEFMSSTTWPVRLVDFEMHMRACPDAAFTSRYATDIPPGVQVFDQFLKYVSRPSPAAHLSLGSVDPQGMSQGGHLVPRTADTKPGLNKRSVVIASVDGGHCSLWLEPAYTLRAMFPGMVTSQLVTFKNTDDCLQLHGPGVFDGEDVFVNQKYWGGNPILRAADVLIAQWMGESAKLRAEYSKPVIAYLGFLLLNDPSVGKYHAWSEPIDFFWERVRVLHKCDVHRGQRGAPVDGGPPCAVVYEEPQLAEAAYWQTGQRRPSVRPLSLYVKARHDPRYASKNVLVINRGRIVRDTLFGNALRTMRHPSYPYHFEEQRPGMPFEDMAKHRGAILLPWDMNLVMFHDLYAMDLPLFLPDREGLHHIALAYFARFRKNSEFVGQPFADAMPERGKPVHSYSPFALEYLEPRDYWLRFTEYLRAPSVARFSSLPDLLLQVFALDGVAVSRQMRAHNMRCFHQSYIFWARTLNAFDRHSLQRSVGDGEAPVWHFHTPWVDELCWAQGMSKSYCCDAAHGPEGAPECFDDFWSFHRCCVNTVSFPSMDDAICASQMPSPIDGEPWVQEKPSIKEPFVFLWDEKCGGSSFMAWLKYSVWTLGKLESSFMYTTPGHPVPVGTPFFLKTFGETHRAEFEVVSGHFDWRLLHGGIGCVNRRHVRCLLLVRHPLDRFVSYYLERSDRRFERLLGNKSMDRWSAPALRAYLKSIRRQEMWYSGDETGVFCNRENILCVDRNLTKSDAHPLSQQVRPKSTTERFYFRYLGGPQNRLTWILDPERGSPRTAIWRMRRCVVGLQIEDFEGFREVLGWYFPWIHEVRDPTQRERKTAPRARGLRGRLPLFAKRLIEEYNANDMKVYRAARQQFRKQLTYIRLASGARNRTQVRWPPVANVRPADVQDKVAEALKHTATYKFHSRLTEFMVR